jgi:hypothetical protein
MCESVFKTAGEQQGNGMETAWERHGMCESAVKVSPYLDGILEAWLAVNVPNVVTQFSLTDGHQCFFGT